MLDGDKNKEEDMCWVCSRLVPFIFKKSNIMYMLRG